MNRACSHYTGIFWRDRILGKQILPLTIEGKKKTKKKRRAVSSTSEINENRKSFICAIFPENCALKMMLFVFIALCCL